jgi:hypothetical protein
MNISDIFYVIAIIYMLVSIFTLIVFVFVLYRVTRFVKRMKMELLKKSKILEVFRYSLQFEVLQKILHFINGKRGGVKR